MKRYQNYYCPNCKKKRKFENFPRTISNFGIFIRIILAVFLLLIPLIGWIAAILLVVSIFTDKTGEDEFYCTECGTKVIIK